MRMLDTNGEMFTLIDGACREDNTMPILDPPFDLQIRGTICYKKWRTSVEMEDFNYYPEAEGEDDEEEEEVTEEIPDATSVIIEDTPAADVTQEEDV